MSLYFFMRSEADHGEKPRSKLKAYFFNGFYLCPRHHPTLLPFSPSMEPTEAREERGHLIFLPAAFFSSLDTKKERGLFFYVRGLLLMRLMLLAKPRSSSLPLFSLPYSLIRSTAISQSTFVSAYFFCQRCCLPCVDRLS